jgi:SAM-dependent methyltransferase
MKTMTILNEWDLLAERFNTNKVRGQVHPDAAVNIFVGWPCFLQQINTQANFLNKRSLKILDYGCGAGELCKVLCKEGHKVSGMDCSTKMREYAQKVVCEKVTIFDSSELDNPDFLDKNSEKYDVITSMHVFDWIEDLESTINSLSKLLKKNGIMVFSLFPKNHIVDSLLINDLFEDFDSNTDPQVGVANFDGVRVPVYVRDPGFFNKVFDKLGFDKVLEYYPPYPKEFIKKYNWKASLQPEMMIFTYRKR